MENIGLFIREHRKKKKLSQRALATKARISNTELWKIENGERSNPNPKILNSIAEALGINPTILLEKANYLNLSKVNNSLDIHISPVYHPNLNFDDIEKNLTNKLVSELVSEFNEDLDVEFNTRINYSLKLDVMCFSKSGRIIAIDYKFILSNKISSFFINQLQNKVKSDFADFYFNYKKIVKSEDLLNFYCVFIVNDSINTLELENLINSFSTQFSPTFKYKIFSLSKLKKDS
ncbi:helix-turn-helix domain-containing protein [Clostridium perfringens]|uniref:helix-turn-helix domain-containing protein n=1 Tax=Clostridium perfringens TaxID=1502 RepID=UPI003CFA593B